MAPSAESAARLSLLVAMVVLMIGNSVPMVVLSPAAVEMGVSAAIFTLVLSLNGIVTAIAAPFWGSRSSVQGRKPIVLIGLSGFVLSILLLAVILDGGVRGWLPVNVVVAGFFAGWAFYGVAAAGIQPPVMAYFADTSDVRTRTRSMAILGIAMGIGGLLGPMLGGGLALFGFIVPLLVFSALGALCIGPIWKFVDPSVGKQLRRDDEPQLRLRIRDPRIFPYLLLIGLLFGLFIGTVGIAAFYLGELFGWESVDLAARTGVFLFILSATTLITQLIIVRLAVAGTLLIKLCFPILTLSLLILGLATTALWIGISYGLFGIAIAVGLTGCNAMTTLSVEPQEVGAAAGLLVSATQVGIMIGPGLSGFLFEQSHNLPMLSGAALSAVASIYVLMRVHDPARSAARLGSVPD